MLYLCKRDKSVHMHAPIGYNGFPPGTRTSHRAWSNYVGTSTYAWPNIRVRSMIRQFSPPITSRPRAFNQVNSPLFRLPLYSKAPPSWRWSPVVIKTLDPSKSTSGTTCFPSVRCSGTSSSTSSTACLLGVGTALAGEVQPLDPLNPQPSKRCTGCSCQCSRWTP